jgi:hypothetical protein
MKIKTVENQTIIDLAIQLYGSAEAVERLLSLNTQLTDSGFDWEITDVLPEGTVINYEEEGSDKKVLKELDGKLIISE